MYFNPIVLVVKWRIYQNPSEIGNILWDYGLKAVQMSVWDKISLNILHWNMLLIGFKSIPTWKQGKIDNNKGVGEVIGTQNMSFFLHFWRYIFLLFSLFNKRNIINA